MTSTFMTRFRFIWIDSVTHMAGMVPQPHRRLGQAIFVSKYTYACCGQHEKSPGRGFEPEPASSEHSEKMPTGKYQHIAFDRAHTAYHVIGPRANLVRRLSLRTAVAE